MEQTSAFESTLATQLESMLSSVVGADKSVVTVNADLDFDKSTATSETFTAPDPNGQPLASQQSNRTEEYQGAVPGSSGVLGPTTAVAGSGSDTSYKLEETSSDSALNRVVGTTERAGRSSASRSLSRRRQRGQRRTGGGDQNLVTAAAGVDATRGDQIVVTRLPFGELADATESSSPRSTPNSGGRNGRSSSRPSAP
jgi:flagellar M-ring protein FliF